jgi:hypothetical protein
MILPTALSVWLSIELPHTKIVASVVAGALQLAGLVITFFGIAGDAKQFGRSLAEPFKTWWGKRKPILVKAVGRAGISGFGAHGIGHVGIAPPPRGTTEERIKWLEERLVAVQNQADVLARSLSETKDNLTKALSDETRTREIAVGRLRDDLRAHAVGSIHLNALGLYWVLVGTVLGVVVGVLT